MFPEAVCVVLQRFESAGYEAYVVGGCVRDLLLGRMPEDWDMTTSALPEETMALFEGYSIPTGLQHGTVSVKWGEQQFEVTTFRCDGVYEDNRHPREVSFTRSLSRDLRRRDFTVNAMAMDLRGQLYDPCGGQEDLRRGVIRCVGDADIRFREDALRMMRALRFSAMLGFEIEADTARAIRENRGLLCHISAERLRVEMDKLLCGRKAPEVLRGFPEILGVFLPELLPMVGFDQKNPHHCYDLWEHTLRAVAAVPAEPLMRWTMLLHDVGKPQCFTLDRQGEGHFYGHPVCGAQMAETVACRLRFDKKTTQRMVQLIAWHDRNIERSERGVARAVRELGQETFRQLCAVKRADNLAQHPDFRWVQQEIRRTETIAQELLNNERCLTLKQLAVNGRDMMALGLRGRVIGETLENLLSQVVDGVLPNDRLILMEKVHQDKRGR